MTPLRVSAARLSFLAAAALAAAAGPGCKKTDGAPPIQGLRPADEVRPTLLASVSIAPLERTLGDVDALTRALSLPFSSRDLLTMVAAQNELAPEAFAELDPGRPIGIAYVAPPTRDQPPLTALVASTRSVQAVEKLVAALGSVGEGQQGARRVQRPDGSIIWVATRGTSLFASYALEGLEAASALAVEAQRTPAEDIVVTLFPEALARWRGTDPRSALAALSKELVDEPIAAAARRGAAVPGRAERITYEAAAEALIVPLAEATSTALSLDIDPGKGIRFGLLVKPRAGSALARQVAAPTAYTADPALVGLPGAEAVAGLWAVGPSPFWLDVYGAVLAAQSAAGLKGAAEVRQHFQSLRPGLSGAASGALRAPRQGGVTADLVLPLAPGRPAAALDGLAALTGSRGFVDLLAELYGRQAPTVQARLQQQTLRTELAFPVRDRPGDVGTGLRTILGSATVTTLATVGAGRLLLATEPGAAARLAGLATPTSRPPPADLAATLRETRGQDGLLYLDLWATARPAMAVLARDPQAAQMLGMATALPGFANLKLPVVGTYRGGTALAGELRIPLATLHNAAEALRPLLGGGALGQR